MNTCYHVTASTTGAVLGIFPEGEIAAAMDLLTANPGASIKPVVTRSDDGADLGRQPSGVTSAQG